MRDDNMVCYTRDVLTRRLCRQNYVAVDISGTSCATEMTVRRHMMNAKNSNRKDVFA